MVIGSMSTHNRSDSLADSEAFHSKRDTFERDIIIGRFFLFRL